VVKEPSYSTMDIDNLDFYYEDCVVGGPGSFGGVDKDREKIQEAIRTKLRLRVAADAGTPGGAAATTAKERPSIA